MVYRFDLRAFAPKFSKYLKADFIDGLCIDKARLFTGDIWFERDKTLHMDVYLEVFKNGLIRDPIYLGEYTSYFDKDNNDEINKLHREFVSDCPLFEEPLRLINDRITRYEKKDKTEKDPKKVKYVQKSKKNVRRDTHKEIPFP